MSKLLDLHTLCSKCTGACCKQGGRDFAVLLEDDENGYDSVAATDGMTDGLRAIPYQNGQCVYLGVDNRCTIYERRPAGCRDFDCTANYPDRISYFLEGNPEVLQLIQLEIKRHGQVVTH